MGKLSNAQGQLTPQSQVRSCLILNQCEILWLSLIPARVKKNQAIDNFDESISPDEGLFERNMKITKHKFYFYLTLSSPSVLFRS